MSAHGSPLPPSSPRASGNRSGNPSGNKPGNTSGHRSGNPSGHRSAGGPPGGSSGVRKRPLVRALAPPLAAASVAGLVCVWVVDRAAAEDRAAVTATGALASVLLGVTVALALCRRRLARELRARTDAFDAQAARTIAAQTEAARRALGELEAAQRAVRDAEVSRRTATEAELSLRAALKAETARAAALEGETARLAEVTIPLVVSRLRAGGAADTVMSGLARPAGAAHERLLSVLIREIGAGERTRAAVTTVCAGAGSRMQTLTAGILADLREMEQRHGGDPRLLGELLHLGDRAARAGRLADSIAVLTGSGTGRRWSEPVPVDGVVRGAISRIGGYPRVRLHERVQRSAGTAGSTAVAGHAAEDVMHALGELLDNACRFSPTAEDVHVDVRQTHAGVVVTVEDAGAMMPDATRVRAEKLVSGDPLDPRALSGTRLGLTVVGCLARAHGLLVSFRPSSLGGTCTVLLIPEAIVTPVPESHPVTPHHPVDPPRNCPMAEWYDAPPPVPPPPCVPLPKRSPGHTLGAVQHGDLSSDPTATWLDPAPDDQPRS